MTQAETRPLWLGDDPNLFPATSSALNEPNGLLAVGGDLSPERLIAAYSRGIFPWYSDDQPILWWTPQPRLVFVPGQVKQSKSLKKHLRQNALSVTLNQDFKGVIEACRSVARNGQDGTWITQEMLDAYVDLHEYGVAHSVETRNAAGELIGGLYGVALGGVFFGESMFSHATNASKVAITVFSDWLAKHQFGLIDCQVENPHLLSLGGLTVNRHAFESQLKQHVAPRQLEFKGFWEQYSGKTLFLSQQHPQRVNETSIEDTA